MKHIFMYLFLVAQTFFYSSQSHLYCVNHQNYSTFFNTSSFYHNTKRSFDVNRGDNQNENEKKDILKLIRDNEIKLDSFNGPFGLRSIVYCDYTASGRPLEFIEEYIKEKVLPAYANTHTTITVTAHQTTLFREEARDIIKKSVNANEHDALIFTGSGTTSAINKLVHCMNFKEPPIVFVSLFEHHSNLLVWREIAKNVITIGEDENGTINVHELEEKLRYFTGDLLYSKAKLIGSFSAASNVTGILTDVDRIAIIMHKYGGFAFFDYAAAAPYVEINMNPKKFESLESHLAYKDAIFISTHKFVGGPQTPGILVAKTYLFQNEVPHGVGGGTVLFVTDKGHEYLKNIEEREEGGTPAIVESIRAGLVFKLKDDCNIDIITQKEHNYTNKVMKFLKEIKNLKLLGSSRATRLPIFSFLIENVESGFYLHHNFVSALLNDLFGIQTRSGCACAGPYGQKLLGISTTLAENYLDVIKSTSQQRGIFKPGFTRFSVTYFMDEETVDFILECIKFVAEYGWMFLPFYESDIESGTWRFRSELFEKTDYDRLSDISYFKQRNNKKSPMESLLNSNELKKYISYAHHYTQKFHSFLHLIKDDMKEKQLNEFERKLIWFLQPFDAYRLLYSRLYQSENTSNTPSRYNFHYNYYSNQLLPFNSNYFYMNRPFSVIEY